MGGNKRHGYARGNASGRRAPLIAQWWCHGCGALHHHTRSIEGVGILNFCESRYSRLSRSDKAQIFSLRHAPLRYVHLPTSPEKRGDDETPSCSTI